MCACTAVMQVMLARFRLDGDMLVSVPNGCTAATCRLWTTKVPRSSCSGKLQIVSGSLHPRITRMLLHTAATMMPSGAMLVCHHRMYDCCRYRKLPFEANPSCWDGIPEADARSLIQSLLKTKPQERATASSLLTSPMLAGMELLSTQ